jgi:enolase
VKSSVDALGLLSKVIESAGFTLGKEFFLGLDVAGSNLFDKRKAIYRLDGREFTSGELMDYYRELASTYKLVYLEDPFHEGDFDSFSALQRMLSGTIVVGDDLYVTNQERLLIGCKSKSTRGVIVKPNQVGTLTDAIEFAEMALGCGNLRVVSHRSGDTEDPFIADLAVGVSSEFIKTGAPARGERTSKYNRLLYIEEEYSLEYAGRRVLTMI